MLWREVFKMMFLEKFKSKKIRLGMVAIGVIVLGFFVFMFVNSGGPDLAPERARSAQRTRNKPISKPQKEKPVQSPLFEALKKWKDPFRNEDPQLVQLQDKIDATRKEIEYLKASLEEKKLRQEIKELEKFIGAGTGTAKKETGLGTGERGMSPSQKRVLVKAILITDEEKSALIVSGGKKTWVHEGEEFDGWEIKKIKTDSVVLSRAGKTYVFFYDGFGFIREGRS
jgi:type IV pilus biogenesis protein PilP